MSYSSSHMARTLKVKRTERGWNQEQLAEAAGLSKSAIARYEAELNAPSFDAVCKLADALGCDTDDFHPNAVSA